MRLSESYQPQVLALGSRTWRSMQDPESADFSHSDRENQQIQAGVNCEVIVSRTEKFLMLLGLK